MRLRYSLPVVLALVQCTLYGQVIQPELHDTTQWKVFNRTAEPANEDGKKVIRFNEIEGNGLLVFKKSDFYNATVEMDIKGSNKMQQSFVGFAFHVQDFNTYDAIYFRPFNFKSDDPVRRSHAVQYISMPNYDWEKLRNQFPGKYENKIEPSPSPDDWFHAKIIIDDKRISVFVNNSQQASLEVEKLNANTHGSFALWLGNNSGGSFANLKITRSDNR